MNTETQRMLVYQAIDENIDNTISRWICKKIYEYEINGWNIIRPTNQWLLEKYNKENNGDCNIKTFKSKLSEAKKSGFISTTGKIKNRTFELNVNFLKEKIAEIVGKRMFTHNLDIQLDNTLGNTLNDKSIKNIEKIRLVSENKNPISISNSISISNIGKSTKKISNEAVIIKKIIDTFKNSGVNKSANLFFKNKTEREACVNLAKTYGIKKVIIIIKKILPKTNLINYMPTITTPYELFKKWASLETNLIKLKNKKIKEQEDIYNKFV